MVKVIFRMWKDEVGGCIAIMPEISEGPYKVLSYEHIGQHGACDRSVIGATRPAKPDEYAKLQQELESAPYNYEFQVIQRWPA
jgi:hypothetical protein